MSYSVTERKNVDKIKDADESSENHRKEYHRQSLKYVDTLLTVEEEKKYQIPEHIHLYTKIWTNAFESTVDEIERFKGMVTKLSDPAQNTLSFSYYICI